MARTGMELFMAAALMVATFAQRRSTLCRMDAKRDLVYPLEGSFHEAWAFARDRGQNLSKSIQWNFKITDDDEVELDKYFQSEGKCVRFKGYIWTKHNFYRQWCKNPWENNNPSLTFVTVFGRTMVVYTERWRGGQTYLAVLMKKDQLPGGGKIEVDDLPRDVQDFLKKNCAKALDSKTNLSPKYRAEDAVACP